jgi:hypothetical protein
MQSLNQTHTEDGFQPGTTMPIARTELDFHEPWGQPLIQPESFTDGLQSSALQIREHLELESSLLGL